MPRGDGRRIKAVNRPSAVSSRVSESNTARLRAEASARDAATENGCVRVVLILVEWLSVADSG